MRENRAIVNEVRLAAGRPLLVDTVTDVLRLACGVSGGDVTLSTPTRFRSFRRAERRALLEALDAVAVPAKLGDVPRHREPWKRLGERLHPHEYPKLPRAAHVFEVARGVRHAASFDSRVEAALSAGRTGDAVALLGNTPGALLRRLDHLLRSGHDASAVLDAAEKAAAGASGRVLLSLREHLQNRLAPAAGRVFTNRHGGAWAAPDARAPLGEQVLSRAVSILDEEITRRLPDPGELVIDPGRARRRPAPVGQGRRPRPGDAAARIAVAGGRRAAAVLRALAAGRAAYRLRPVRAHAGRRLRQRRAHLVDELRQRLRRVLRGPHRGASDGASEFINIRLADAALPIIIPQVHIFAGEAFDEAAEAFFGYMTRDAEQEGRPFETAHGADEVRPARRGACRRCPSSSCAATTAAWRVKWLHLYLKGHPSFNQVEGNRVTSSLLVRSIVERDHLRVRYLADLLRAKNSTAGHTTYIGLQAPADLPEGARVYTPGTLHELIPA